MSESKARTVYTSHTPGGRGKSEPSRSYVRRTKNAVKLGQKAFQRYAKFLSRVLENRVLSALFIYNLSTSSFSSLSLLDSIFYSRCFHAFLISSGNCHDSSLIY